MDQNTIPAQYLLEGIASEEETWMVAWSPGYKQGGQMDRLLHYISVRLRPHWTMLASKWNFVEEISIVDGGYVHGCGRIEQQGTP